MKLNQLLPLALLFGVILTFTSCDVLKTLQTAQQVNTGTLSVVQGDMTLPGAQKGGTVIANIPYKSVYKPNGIRYKDDVFQNVSKTTETYATGAKEFNGQSKDLVLDIYEPAGDKTTGRPCVIFVFGGGWFMKTVDGMEQFGQAFAKKGYVGVSIDYRIGFKNASAMMKCMNTYSGFHEAWYRAAQDSKAAIRYLKANADRLGIDKDKIFIGGHSAGAFTSLNAVHLDQQDVPESITSVMGGVNSIGNHQNENTNVAGSYILAGAAINTLNYIDKSTPTYLLMGTCDEFIVNGTGNVYRCASNPTIYGGQPLFDKLKSNGACVEFDVSCGGDHGFGKMTFEQMTGLVSNFTYNVLKGNCNTSKEGIPANQVKCQEKDPVCN
jgi:acetyl esterase/lipase